ncbi:flagellar biosynthesis protein FlhF [Gammaproteobacteria bacterium]
MKIKRFFAADIRQAMRLVREAQGPDAVILSNRKVEGGVEIVSAVDLDENMLASPAARDMLAASVGASAAEGSSATSPANRTTTQTPSPTPKPVLQKRDSGSNPEGLATSQTSTLLGNANRSVAVHKPGMTAPATRPPLRPRTPAPAPSRTAPSVTRPAPASNSTGAKNGVTKPSPPPPPQRIPSYDPPAVRPSANAPASWSEDGQEGSAVDLRYPGGDSSRASRPADTLWATQDTALSGMREELKELRGLLEHQLSGLAWGDAIRRTPVQARLLRALTELGLSVVLARELVGSLGNVEEFDPAWRQAMGQLAERIETTEDAILGPGGVVALVGATGVGKTTTVAKLAAHYALRHGREQVGLITTDGYRIGSQEQLRTFARILGSPMRTAGSTTELAQALEELADCGLVLVDTTGMGQRDLRLSEQLAALKSAGRGIRSYLVLSAITQRAGLEEVVRAFAAMEVSGCILTKLDEAASLGEVLSVVIRQRLSVTYLGIGQRVPEDLVPARAHNLVSRAVALLQHNTPDIEEETLAMAFGGNLQHATAP